VLRATLALSENPDGSKPSVSQLLAVMALHPACGGIRGEMFRRAVNFVRARGERTENPEDAFWLGSVENFYHGFNLKAFTGKLFPELVLDCMVESQGSLLSSSQLLENLPDELPIKKARQFLNPVLQFLRAAGAVIRHPDHKDPRSKKMVSMWALAGVDPVKPVLRSPELLVLQHASTGSGWLKDLYNSTAPCSDLKFSHHSIMNAARLLQNLGFLRITREVPPDPEHLSDGEDYLQVADQICADSNPQQSNIPSETAVQPFTEKSPLSGSLRQEQTI